MTYRAQANRRARSRRGGFRYVSKHHPGEIRMPWHGQMRLVAPGHYAIISNGLCVSLTIGDREEIERA